MKSWKKKLVVAALGITASIGVLTGCGNADSANTGSSGADGDSKNQTDHLNIATQPAPGYLPLTILEDKGWLEEALKEAGYDGVTVTFTEFESGPPENESFAAGQQDVGVMGNVPSISGVAAGQDRTFIGISTNGEKTQAVLVPADSDIKSVADLKGKKVGLVVGSISQNLLDTLLKQEGLSINDVELVNLATAEQSEALATGQIDAVTTWQPTISQLQNDGIAEVLADGTGVFLGENTIFSCDSYLEENPEIVKIFLQQYARAAQELTDNLDQYAEEYADKYGIDQELLKQALVDADFPIALTDADIEDLQGTADFLYDSGIVSTQVTVSEHVDASLAQDEEVQQYLK